MTTVTQNGWRVDIDDQHVIVDAITTPSGETTSEWTAWHRAPDAVRDAAVDAVDDASHVEDLCPVHAFAR